MSSPLSSTSASSNATHITCTSAVSTLMIANMRFAPSSQPPAGVQHERRHSQHVRHSAAEWQHQQYQQQQT